MAAVDFYSAGLEEHHDSGKHFHICILLSKPKIWNGAQKYLTSLGMNVNFAISGAMYAGAYYYTTKTDKDYHHSDAFKQHPHWDFIETPNLLLLMPMVVLPVRRLRRTNQNACLN